jgi:uncharacterized alpha-E superfamily protein
MYRRHVGVHVNGPSVVHFLLNNPHFPRSVMHCLAEIESCLEVLPAFDMPMKSVRRAWRRLEIMRYDDLTPVVLHEYLDQIQADMGDVHEALSHQYFYLHHAPVTAEMLAVQV